MLNNIFLLLMQLEFLTFHIEQKVQQYEKEKKNKCENSINASIWSRSMAARFPRDWREVKGTELTGKDGGAIETVGKVERVIIDPSDSDT